MSKLHGKTDSFGIRERPVSEVVVMQRITWLAFLTSLLTVVHATAQVPPPPPTVAPAVAAPAAPTNNLWSYICPTPAQRAACINAYCQSPIGQLSSSAMAPLSGLSGGLLQNCCVTNAIEQGLLQPPDSAVGAAAAIKKSEAAAAARRAAVRYLGTCDCNWWPEAEAALINALLKDPNECVRLEAAIALQKGCCCNIRIMKALTESVSGTGKPPENSERVRTAAYIALSRCCTAVEPTPVEPLPVPKTEDGIKKVKLDYVEFYGRAKPAPQPDVVQEAKRALAQAATATDPSTGNAGMAAMAARPGSVSQILSTAFGASPRSAGMETAEFMPQATTGMSEMPSGAPATPVARTLFSPPAFSTAPPAAPPQQATSGGRERPPFFDALTRALKGKQAGQPSGTAADTVATTSTPLSPGLAKPALAATPSEELPAGQPEMPAFPVIGPAEEQMPAELPKGPSVPH